jgi:exopolysaccharide biosynthesis polyprenyl glycosylphosphotransferase
LTPTGPSPATDPLHAEPLLADAAPAHLRLQRRRDPVRRGQVRRASLVVADATAVLVVGVLMLAVAGPAVATAVLLTGPLWVLVAKAHGLYDADGTRAWHLTLDEAPKLLSWATSSVALTWVVLSATAQPIGGAAPAIGAWAVALLTSASLRTAARAVWRRWVPSERVVLLGSGPNADLVLRKVSLERGHHLRVVNRVATPSAGASLEELRRAVRTVAAHRVIAATDDLSEALVRDVAVLCRQEGVHLSIAPPLRTLLGRGTHLSLVADLPLVDFKTAQVSRWQAAAKRATDLAISVPAGLLLAPLFLALAIAVRLDSPGPAFFRQRRAGRDGVPFTMWKFRTMVVGAEAARDDVVDLDALDGPAFKLRADPRVTRVGRLLRATSLDELPQLLNVVRGDMSLVGPRPEELDIVERYSTEEAAIRLTVKPGLTGPMQVHGRGELTFSERLSVERDYVEHFSLGRDWRILARTVGVVARRTGAF